MCVPSWFGLALCLSMGSACTGSSHRSPDHPFLSRFEAALSLVPHNMDSLWMLLPTREWPARTHLELRCGRDWDSESDVRYRQLFDGVVVEDHGAVGVPEERIEDLRKWSPLAGSEPMWYREAREVGAHRVDPAQWATIVDGRFVVMANTRDLLQEAMARPGGSGAIVEHLLASVEVPDDTIEIVHHRFRKIRLVDGESPAVDWNAMILAGTPARFEWWGPALDPRASFGTGLLDIEHHVHFGTHVWRLTAAQTSDHAFMVEVLMAFAFGVIPVP